MTTQTRTDTHETRTNSPSATITWTGSTRDIAMALALALSLIMNGFCVWVIDSYQREVRLKEYDLAAFKAGEFTELKAQTKAHEMVIQELLNKRK